MKIRMLQTQRGSPDGMSLLTYVEGEIYDLSGSERARDLAAVFVREKWAVEFVAKAPPETASMGAAPENKGPAAEPPKADPYARGKRKG